MEFYSPATMPSPKAAIPVLICYLKFKGHAEVMAGYWIPKDNYSNGTFKYLTTGNHPMWREMNLDIMLGWAYLPKSPEFIKIKLED